MNYKEKRILKGWSQAELAEKIGKSPRTVFGYEKDPTSIPASMIRILDSVLGDSSIATSNSTHESVEYMHSKENRYLGIIENLAKGLANGKVEHSELVLMFSNQLTEIHNERSEALQEINLADEINELKDEKIKILQSLMRT